MAFEDRLPKLTTACRRLEPVRLGTANIETLPSMMLRENVGNDRGDMNEMMPGFADGRMASTTAPALMLEAVSWRLTAGPGGDEGEQRRHVLKQSLHICKYVGSDAVQCRGRMGYVY